MKNNIINKSIKLILFEISAVLVAFFSAFLLLEIKSEKTDIKKTELILENKYILILKENERAQLLGGVNGLYGEKGEEELKEIYENEEKYKEIIENLYVEKLITKVENKRREPDYIGYIQKEIISPDDSNDIKNVKNIKNKYKGGYFYSSDTDNEIKFGVDEEEIRKKYGNLIDKMKQPKEIINKHGINPNGNNINETRNFIIKKIFSIWLLLNVVALLFIKFIKKRIL